MGDMRIKSPGTGGPFPALGGAPTVTVGSGETAGQIAQRCGVALDALMKANPQIGGADQIKGGMVLNLPAGGVSPKTDTPVMGGLAADSFERQPAKFPFDPVGGKGGDQPSIFPFDPVGGTGGDQPTTLPFDPVGGTGGDQPTTSPLDPLGGQGGGEPVVNRRGGVMVEEGPSEEKVGEGVRKVFSGW